MTNEQINIAIAEACGWTHYHLDLWVPSQQTGDPDDFSELQCTGLPDYCNNLNAMHEAERVLNAYQRHKYTLLLRGDCASVDSMWEVAHKPAIQRAEAFLRTIGKWEGETK